MTTDNINYYFPNIGKNCERFEVDIDSAINYIDTKFDGYAEKSSGTYSIVTEFPAGIFTKKYFCINCDKEIKQEFKYCPYCGNKVNRYEEF